MLAACERPKLQIKVYESPKSEERSILHFFCYSLDYVVCEQFKEYFISLVIPFHWKPRGSFIHMIIDLYESFLDHKQRFGVFSAGSIHRKGAIHTEEL